DHDVKADIVMLRSELSNAVITSDVLDLLRKVATPGERSALMKLEVVTAAAYRQSDRQPDAGAWCRAVMAEPITEVHARVAPGTTQDKRTRAWFGVPLADYIGPLIEARRRCKAPGNAGGKEREFWAGRSTVIKLMINGLYGDFASRFFEIGNAVLANCITARGRVGVWMLAKALRLRQSITDGGIYDPLAVPHWWGKR